MAPGLKTSPPTFRSCSGSKAESSSTTRSCGGAGTIRLPAGRGAGGASSSTCTLVSRGEAALQRLHVMRHATSGLVALGVRAARKVQRVLTDCSGHDGVPFSRRFRERFRFSCEVAPEIIRFGHVPHSA